MKKLLKNSNDILDFDFDKNLIVDLDTLTHKSTLKIWWKCKFGHSWERKVCCKRGCPFCTGKIPTVENNLQKYKQLCNEWHSEKNEGLTPLQFSKGSNKKIWWKCQFGHEWQAKIKSRVRGNNCPFCRMGFKSSRLEIRLISELEDIFPDVKHRHKINGFECDIFIPKLDLAIECDGSYWHRDKEERDLRKIMVLNRVKLSGLENFL